MYIIVQDLGAYFVPARSLWQQSFGMRIARPLASHKHSRTCRLQPCIRRFNLARTELPSILRRNGWPRCEMRVDGWRFSRRFLGKEWTPRHRAVSTAFLLYGCNRSDALAGRTSITYLNISATLLALELCETAGSQCPVAWAPLFSRI